MADFPPKKNAAWTWYFVIRDADGDPVAGATSLDVEFSIDGGVFADVAGVEVDEGQGFYSCPISAGEMNGDVIMLMCKTATAGAKTAAQVVYTATRQIVDLAYPAVSGQSIQVEADGMVHADLKEWLGVAPLALDTQRVQALAVAIAAGAVNAAAVATDAIDADAIADNAIDVGAIAAGAITSSEAPALANLDAAVSTRAIPGDLMGLVADGITAAKIAADAIGASELAADAVTEIRDAIVQAVLSELPQAAPPATPQLGQAIMLLYMAVRNLLEVTASEKRITNDAGVVIAKKALADDGTTFQEAEMVSGP